MKKGKKSEEKTHPYDFTLKRSTKPQQSVEKPIRPDIMASGMIRAHGFEKAKNLVEPMTVTSFKDAQGNPITVNTSANYWKTVAIYISKAGSNAKSN